MVLFFFLTIFVFLCCCALKTKQEILNMNLLLFHTLLVLPAFVVVGLGVFWVFWGENVSERKHLALKDLMPIFHFCCNL